MEQSDAGWVIAAGSGGEEVAQESPSCTALGAPAGNLKLGVLRSCCDTANIQHKVFVPTVHSHFTLCSSVFDLQISLFLYLVFSFNLSPSSNLLWCQGLDTFPACSVVVSSETWMSPGTGSLLMA